MHDHFLLLIAETGRNDGNFDFISGAFVVKRTEHNLGIAIVAASGIVNKVSCRLSLHDS